jgi:hypothetical protein
MLRISKLILNTLAIVGAVFLGMTAFAVAVAHAHTGTPSPTTWSSGNPVTYQNLNDTVQHMHNTFSGGIVDAHISSSAAITHSKMARPGLIAKAVFVTTSTMDPSVAAGTDLVTGIEQVQFLSTSGGAGSGNSALEATGTAGTYQLTLNYTPTDTAFMVLITAHTTSVWCSTTGRSTSAPHITIACENDVSTLTNTAFSIVVFDTN